MTLPSPAPVGLSLARFRAGFGRAVGAVPAARRWTAGAARSGEYRSPFPARLRAARAAVTVAALLWLAAGFFGLDAARTIVRTVGHDTAPSVSAAEAIRTGLAAANADFALAMVSNEGADGALLSDMRLRLRAVRAAIVVAAGNVTYGDEERGPIGTVLQGLGEYEQLVGRSVANGGDARRDLAFAADDLLHWTVLPAAVTLERVNAGHLDEDYRAYQGRSGLVTLIAAAAVALILLVAVQVDVARTARRLLNPGLLLATAAVLAVTALVALRLLATQADLRVAKADAFDSIYALSTARALAADADAAQSFRLLAGDDAARERRQRDTFDALSARLLPAEGRAAVRAADQGRNLGGYLGDALANTTFEGERDAAGAAVWAWDEVRSKDRELRNAEALGERAGALASKTANLPWSTRTALARFDAALDKVLAINARAFASATVAAEGDDGPLGAALAAGFVVAVAAAWFGIGRRLDEYRF